MAAYGLRTGCVLLRTGEREPRVAEGLANTILVKQLTSANGHLH